MGASRGVHGGGVAAAGAAAGAPAAGEWPPPNNRHVVTVALGFAAAVGTVAACVANSASLSESSRDIATQCVAVGTVRRCRSRPRHRDGRTQVVKDRIEWNELVREQLCELIIRALV